MLVGSDGATTVCFPIAHGDFSSPDQSCAATAWSPTFIDSMTAATRKRNKIVGSRPSPLIVSRISRWRTKYRAHILGEKP